ncbi:MAG: hypothetical protein WCR47_08245 [Desulfoplanes sp.]|nr:hypothetical protein [Desulfoplanes sp.]
MICPRGYKQSGTLAEKKRAYFYTRRGLAWLELGKRDKAESDAAVALEMDKNSPRAHFLKSKLLRSMGDGAGAIKEARIAYRLGGQRFNQPVP